VLPLLWYSLYEKSPYALAALIVRIEFGDPMGEPAGFSLSKPVLGESP
jgi:hypothetical protein